MSGSIVSFDKLLEDMAGKDTLQGFDVLVAYRESLISEWISNHQPQLLPGCLNHDWLQDYTSKLLVGRTVVEIYG
jgi:hypothetical protein